MASIYGAEHEAIREQLRPVVEHGEAYCTEIVCLMPDRWIRPGSRWDLAHDRTTGGYLGPAHARCNRSEGAAFGNRSRGLAPAQPETWSSRSWPRQGEGRVES